LVIIPENSDEWQSKNSYIYILKNYSKLYTFIYASNGEHRWNRERPERAFPGTK